VTAHLAGARRELAGRTTAEVAERLARNHGAEWRGPIALAAPGPLQTVAGSETLAVEVVYAVRHEMARTLGDCVLRRTDLATAGHPGEPTLAACADLMAGELGWDAARVASEIADVRERLHSAPASPGVAMGSV
jgi:glycerol-3-phosphate dehydrogenase